MKNKEIREALKAIIEMPVEELIQKHPTIAALKTEFVDYSADGKLTLAYPVQANQINGYHLMQGGNIASAFDNNFGIFVYVALDGHQAPTIDMVVNFHKGVTLEDEKIWITTQVKSAGKKVISLTGEARNKKGQLVASSQTHMLNLDGAYLYI